MSDDNNNRMNEVTDERPPQEKCKWHKQFQNKIKSVRNLIDDHKPVELTNEAFEASRNLNKKFEDGERNYGELSQWEKIKTFHVKPLVFKMRELQLLVEDEIKGKDSSMTSKRVREEISDLKSKIVMQIRKELKAKHGIKEEGELTKIIHKMKVKEYVDTHLSGGDIGNKYLSEKSEMIVEDAFLRIMSGKPGMLRRGLIRNKNTYQHLKEMIGDIPPLYCKCKSEICQLKDECYDMEIDLILLYPCESKICVIINEVKKIEGEMKNFKQVQVAFSQLLRDVKLILSLLIEVPAENIFIKTFAVFPENKTHHLFCQKCSEFILSKEDFDLGLEHLKEKLCIKETELNDENEILLLKACSRMIGGDDSDDSSEAINKYMINFEDTVDTLIFLDEHQQSLLRTLDENPEVKNFALKGPSGCGKTIISIKIVNKLIDKYLSQKVDNNVFVYAIVHDTSESDIKLLKYFEENIIKQDKEKVFCSFLTFSQILFDMNIERGDENPSDIIQELCNSIKNKHENHTVIIVIDECETDSFDAYQDEWESLCPPGANDSPTEDFVTNFHLILSLTPIQRHHMIDDIQYSEIFLNEQVFMVKTLKTRYRNSHKITRLIKYLNSKFKNLCLQMDENSAPCISGIVAIKP